LEVINAAEAQRDAVSPSVLLAVMQDIPWREEEARQQILRPRQEFIVKTIIENAAAGLEQAYKTLAAVARFWSLESPEVLDTVLQTIARPDMDRLEDDETRHGFADVLLEYGRGRGEAGAESLETALALFEGATRSKPFNEQRKAELLIEMSRYEEAEAILVKRADLHTKGWIQRLMARALLGAGRPNDALGWIDRALADEDCLSHFHEFWEHRYEIRQVLGETGAPKDLHRAISLAPAGPVKSRLETMLSESHPTT